eukprot:4575105-Alexandrium_andersonii.AAC.1
MSADGERAILQWLVDHGILMESGDLKTAFLSGDEDASRFGDDALFIDAPLDIRKWLKLGPN